MRHSCRWLARFFTLACLLVACTPTVAIPTPTTVATATSPAPTVPPPTETIAPTLYPLAPLAATPLATAPAIRFAGWSPDSRWVAYWVSSQEDVDSALAYWPVGALHFANVETGETCAVPELVSQDGGTIGWSDEGAAIVSTAAGWFSGWPCQAEPYAALTDYAPNEGQTPDPALSPDGRYRATTVLQSSEDGIETFETTITTASDLQPLQRVTWQIDQRIGDYELGGEWVSRSQFLIYESLVEGPLLIDADRGVTPVATGLFGLQEIPSILDEEGYGFRAIAIPGTEPDGFHLLLAGVGVEDNFPRVMLYHAEDGLVEMLPYRYVWWEPFSADHDWLLMDARPTVGGHESHEIQIRRVEVVGGEWRLLATGVDSALWNAEWTEMAFYDDATVTWLTFPDGDLLGRWDTGQFWTYPVAWSPDGRFLATEGNVPGMWQYGLFVLESPTLAPGTVAAIDCADTVPFASGCLDQPRPPELAQDVDLVGVVPAGPVSVAAWSLDGNCLAYAVSNLEADGFQGLEVRSQPDFRLEGRWLVPGIFDLAWSPDGEAVLFVFDRGDTSSIGLARIGELGWSDLLPGEKAVLAVSLGKHFVDWLSESTLAFRVHCGTGCETLYSLDIVSGDLRPLVNAWESGAPYANVLATLYRFSSDQRWLAANDWGTGLSKALVLEWPGPAEPVDLSGPLDASYTDAQSWVGDSLAVVSYPADEPDAWESQSRPNLHVWDASAGTARLVAEGAFRAAFAPTGDRLAAFFVGESGVSSVRLGLLIWPEGELLATYSVDGGVATTPPDRWMLPAPAWSPDGGELAFQSGDEGLSVMDRDGCVWPILTGKIATWVGWGGGGDLALLVDEQLWLLRRASE